MEKVITSILDINKSIDLYFRTSKAPLFIKRFQVARRRNKLKSEIEKIHKMKTISGSLLKEYISLLYLYYPPFGVYKNCRKIEPIDADQNKLSMLFEFVINREDKVYGIVALSPDSEVNDSYLIRYVWAKDGQTIFANAEENVTYFEDKESYKYYEYPYKTTVQNDIIKDYFVKMVLDNIYDFIMEFLTRSERITEKWNHYF